MTRYLIRLKVTVLSIWDNSAGVGSLFYSLGADPTENTTSCSYSIIVMLLPSGSSDIVDVFTRRNQATHFPFRDGNIATALLGYNID
jgi:hypothetical protein